MDDRTQHMLTAPPVPLLVRMATPNAMAFFIQSFVSLAEVWFVGQLGTVSLASIALVFPLLMLTQMMSNGAMGGAITSSIARSLGAGDAERASRLAWHALTLAVAGAALFLVVFLLAGGPFLAFLGGEGEVLGRATTYCLMLFTGGVFLWLVGACSAIFRGMGNMKFPAMLMIVSAVIQVPLSGTLVLGAFGAPQLGIVGAAVSAVASALVISTIMLFSLTRPGQPVRLTRRTLVFSREDFRDIMKVALPASLSPLLTVANILCLTAIVAGFGDQALAGYGIGSRIEFLLVPLVFGLGAAMTSLVGVSIGAGRVDRAERVGWTGSFMAAALSGVVGILLALFPNAWIPAFTDDPDTIAAATRYIQVMGPFFALQGLGLTLYFASQGAGAMAWPVIATIVRLVLAVGGALLLAHGLDMGLTGVFIAAAVAMVTYGLMIAGSLKLGAWRRQV